MEENRPETISYFAHEAEVMRQEKYIKKLWIALLVAIFVVFASNAGWLIYESLYDTITYSQDGNGLNNINTGEQGDLYGTESEDTDTQK